MATQEPQNAANNSNLEHQNQQQVNTYCQNLIGNNQVHSINVLQEGDYLNINIKIKIDLNQIQQNSNKIINSDNLGPNLRQETPVTSTQLVDNSLNMTIINNSLEHPGNDSISYETFKEQLDPQKHNCKPRSSTATVNSLKEIRPKLKQNGLKQKLSYCGKEEGKMLVILRNNEQRLITFKVPKGTCTVQDLLDQVGIETRDENNVECIENSGLDIDYIVKVGKEIKGVENHIHRQQIMKEAPKLITILPPLKFLDGFYSVCSDCGFNGLDIAKCYRCHKVYDEREQNVFPIP